uniref:dihydroorotate dehydrogenase (quinone), mitochondrial-like n=1 Tax=Ciona intestinalis TaxID=7719 RepID=UPI00006A4BA2|nr:dihydroorotate dehydrogenase (quinone), mitochondrial-like [Ciona intestinalis]|eukprot:XP_026689512.1 dihydroorotate dehydrogenase (quinone), mitochondrial-like [Ciona intestinalis]
MSKLRETAALFLGAIPVFLGYETWKGDEKFYSNILMPAIHNCFSPETAHNLAIKLLSLGLVPKGKNEQYDKLSCKVFGQTFSNPLGIAAGFDKHAEAIDGLNKLGFGFVEVGSITPLPQEGNAKPRVFRLPEDKVVINRYGFNSCGHDAAAARLDKLTKGTIVLGVNLGKNKESTDFTKDYTDGVTKLGKYADYIVINVSSPNTPGLRSLQGRQNLQDLCTNVVTVKEGLPNKPSILVKIAPDLTEDDKQDIAYALLQSKVDGLIVSNTTVARPSTLVNSHKSERGGLSGKPLCEVSTKLVADMYKLTDGKLPIIGVGGIWNGKDAYDKIKAGASLIQIYTSLIYEGPPLVGKIKRELNQLLEKDGFTNVAEAVGADHK